MRLKYLLLISFSLATLTAKGDSTPFCANINAMWLSGNRNGVLEIANHRLKSNPNDMAGLILALEYNAAFFKLAPFDACADRVMIEGAKVTTPHFAGIFPSPRKCLQYLQRDRPSYTQDQIEAEAAKGNINGKPMNFISFLQALELDGKIP